MCSPALLASLRLNEELKTRTILFSHETSLPSSCYLSVLAMSNSHIIFCHTNFLYLECPICQSPFPAHQPIHMKRMSLYVLSVTLCFVWESKNSQPCPTSSLCRQQQRTLRYQTNQMKMKRKSSSNTNFCSLCSSNVKTNTNQQPIQESKEDEIKWILKFCLFFPFSLF